MGCLLWLGAGAAPDDPLPDDPADAPDGLMDERPAGAPVVCEDTAQVPPGYVSINTHPWTKVYVDDELLGSTPLFRRALPAGVHQVRLRNDDRGIDVVDEMTIEPGRTLKMRVFLAWDVSASAELSFAAPDPAESAAACAEASLAHPAFLSVRTAPWSKVYVDGKYLGHTPLFRVPVAPGHHVLRLWRDDQKSGLNLFSRFSADEGEVVKVDLAPPSPS